MIKLIGINAYLDVAIVEVDGKEELCPLIADGYDLYYKYNNELYFIKNFN